MARVGTERIETEAFVLEGEAGTNDDDIVLETENVSRYDEFILKSDAGAMDVEVDLGDGTFVGPISLADLGATGTAPVIVTAADRVYGFALNIQRIRVRQNGATAVTGPVLRGVRER